MDDRFRRDQTASNDCQVESQLIQQNMPTPCAGSRSPDAARGSRARAPLCARAPPLLHRTADPGHAQPAAPSGAVSRPSSRSSRQSSGSPTIGKCARLGGPGPSEPREHGPQGNMGELASSWLHPLKSRSLRKTRYGSYRFGARSGLAPIIFGLVVLALAVGFANHAAALFAIIPI